MTTPSRAAIGAALDAFERVPLAVDGSRPAAVAIAVVEGDDGPGVLLTRRAERLRAHAGQWALPGGRIDSGETAVEAALRETDEELGLRLQPEDVLGVLDDYATRSGYVITPVVLWAGQPGELTPNPDEVASVHVTSLVELDVEPRFLTIPESTAPVIQLPLLGSLIHAPTAAVLHQFREVALHRRSTRVAGYEQPVFAWR
jgi:8-oxo-dGTP pyrophosphatase MutT (NUDIX family)